ncbi:hypothetical protein QFZ64_005438 [Streptomyces sp. B3I8]|nr:hypothetical protein [Streptomyces sp. B3I8]
MFFPQQRHDPDFDVAVPRDGQDALKLSAMYPGPSDGSAQRTLLDDEAPQRYRPPREDLLSLKPSGHPLLDRPLVEEGTSPGEDSPYVLLRLQQALDDMSVVGVQFYRLGLQPRRVAEERRELRPRDLLLHLPQDTTRVQEFVPRR